MCFTSGLRAGLTIVSHGVVQERRSSKRSELDQAATAGSLTFAFSVMRASVSSDM